MKLNSALEDLRGVTLQAIVGILRRLEYLAGLGDGERKHGHWGLKRIYGERNANKALTEAHHSVFSQILATPISKLATEVDRSNRQEGIATQPYLERLWKRSVELLPPNPGAGSARHFNSVLHALWALGKIQTRDASPPTASRRPRPVPLHPLPDVAAPGSRPATKDAAAR